MSMLNGVSIAGACIILSFGMGCQDVAGGPGARQRATGVMLDRQFWVFGGATPKGRELEVWRLDIANNVWNRFPDMPTPREYASAVADGDGGIIVAGGCLEETCPPLARVDLDTQGWTAVGAPMEGSAPIILGVVAEELWAVTGEPDNGLWRYAEGWQQEEEFAFGTPLGLHDIDGLPLIVADSRVWLWNGRPTLLVDALPVNNPITSFASENTLYVLDDAGGAVYTVDVGSGEVRHTGVAARGMPDLAGAAFGSVDATLWSYGGGNTKADRQTLRRLHNGEWARMGVGDTIFDDE